MQTLSHNIAGKTVLPQTEIEKIAAFYGFPRERIAAVIAPLSDSFSEYFELVFANEEVEFITAGKGEVFAKKVKKAALRSGLSQKTVDFFTACHQQFPEAITGIKFCFSKKEMPAPTIYVRVKCKMEEALPFLEKHLANEELQPLCAALKDNHVLYGLGFSDKNGKSYLKTYTIGEVEDETGKKTGGFISHRLSGGHLAREHKTYLPEISLSEFEPADHQLQKLVYFLVYELNYTKAGHIGILHRENAADEYKIYVERIGGIPTDFSAR